MKLFVDASAIVAMLADEPDALEIADRLDSPDELLWSPVVQWETVTALMRHRRFDATAARESLFEFGREWAFTLVTIGEPESEMAFEALRLYGRGTGHPAKLNLGDCFAYGCAKAHRARLLYKGNDFSKTDLA